MEAYIELAVLVVTGVIVKVIHTLRRENTEQHEANHAVIKDLQADNLDTKAEVREVKADVRDLKGDVRDVRDILVSQVEGRSQVRV